MKQGRTNSQDLLFSFTIFSTFSHLYFHRSFRINSSVSTKKKCQLGFWWGLLWFTFRQTDILTRLSFLTLVRGLALCLFSSPLTSLSSILLLSVFRSFISLDRFIYNYLNCGAIANGIVALILIFNYLLQICKSMADFSILLYML